MQKYYWSCHLARILDWHLHSKTKAWIGAEETFSPLPIHHLPWIDIRRLPQEHKSHPLSGPTLQVFQTVCKKLNIASTPGPLTPIDRNPDFPPGIAPHVDTGQLVRCSIRAKAFYNNGKLLSFKTSPQRRYSFLQISPNKTFFTKHTTTNSLVQRSHAIRKPLLQTRPSTTHYI